MGNLNQADRLMQFTVAGDADSLLIETLDGHESLSHLFNYHVELLAPLDASQNDNIKPSSVIGAKATVSIGLNDKYGSRYINGIVASLEACGGDDEFNVYRACLVPSLWQLTLNSNCRVFQNKTVIEILKDVVKEYGITLEDHTETSYKKLEYCTQYSESDFHFISRLLEEHGIFYWFVHTDEDHKLQIGDSLKSYADCPVSSEIPWVLNKSGAEGGYGAGVDSMNLTASMVTGVHSTADYDYRGFARKDADKKNSSSTYGKNGYEHYLYPAGEEAYTMDKDSQLTGELQPTFLTARQQASDLAAEVYRGSSNARTFSSGNTFTLSKHPVSTMNDKYLLISIVHHCRQTPSYRTRGEEGGSGYSNTFAAVSAKLVFRPEVKNVKPRIYGPQTAKVVAPRGSEIWIDKLGRVNVQFHWDRLREKDTPDNTWVRVAQQWAGNGWGTFFWPRLNDEVVIEFLNGDPDNPIIVGSVYNGVNVPKYALPDHSTRSGIVTRSSKDGSASNANELRFEDKKGSEQIFLNAEKDFDLRVENDNRRFVGGQDSLIVTKDQLEKVSGSQHVTVEGARAEKIGGNAGTHVAGNLSEKVDGNLSLKVGSSQADKIGLNYSMDSGMNIYLKAGMNLVLEAGMDLTLKGSGGFISIGPSGVAIQGTMVLINSGGAATPGEAGSPTDPDAPKAPDQADDGSKGGAM